jgi:hypothetical protein
VRSILTFASFVTFVSTITNAAPAPAERALFTALGRQEDWEDSPEGYPQTPPYGWWNYHDAYRPDA